MSANISTAGARKIMAGVGIGAIGASAIAGPSTNQTWFEKLFGSATTPGEVQVLSSRMEALARTVSELNKSRGGGSTIVVQGSGSASSNWKLSTLVGLGVLGAGTYLYIRFTSWTVADCVSTSE